MLIVFRRYNLIFILAAVTLLGGLGINALVQAAANPSVACVSCHAAEKDAVSHSKHASAQCLDCHPVQTAAGKAQFESHPNVVTKPGEVENLAKTCGRCHVP
jgi:hypothetical protein